MSERRADKPPTKVAVILIAIMPLLTAGAVVFFYFVAFHGLSPRQMTAAGVLLLMIAIPLMWVAVVVAKLYGIHREE